MGNNPTFAGIIAASIAFSMSCDSAFAQDQETAAEDIVVSARRIDERLQDVPISITVFNQQQLNNRNVTSGNDLATYTPSLQSDTRFGPNNASFSIRGFTQELRTTASVGVYFADVVSPRGGLGGGPVGDGAGPGAFFDLQNVQVLKGPQGTLFGRNTTGGAILLVPQKPTARFEGFVEGSLGNYDMRRLQGVINVPLGENARFRTGVDWQQRDGYLNNVTAAGPRHFNNLNYVAARASLVVDLTPNFENYIIASFSHSRDNGVMAKVTGCDASQLPVGPLVCDQLARSAGRGFYDVENYIQNPVNEARQWQIINTATWSANDNLTVKNITSYSQLTNRQRMELFGANFFIPPTISFAVPGVGVITGASGAFEGTNLGFAQSTNIPGRKIADQSNFTNELQLQGKAIDGDLVWQAGAYYERSTPLSATGAQSPVLLACSDSDNFQCSDPLGQIIQQTASQVFGVPVPFSSVGGLSYSSARVSFQNIGVYGQATYSLTEQLKLTGGLRYTWDETRAQALLQRSTFPTPNNPVTACLYTTGLTPDCRMDVTQKSSAPTWIVGLDYKPVPDVLLYAKYARGYRQGAVSYNNPAPYQTFEPEQVDTYEIGAKTSFNGFVRGTFNVAAFYNDFKDQQLSVGLAAQGGGVSPTLAIINAGKSRIYGAEVEASLSPVEGLTFDASYAYIKSKVVEIADLQPTMGSPYDVFNPTVVEGGRLTQLPTHKLVLTGSYVLPLPEAVGTIAFSTTYSYTSNYSYSVGPNGYMPGVDLLSMNLNWRSVAGSPVDVSLFATNVTKKKFYVSSFDQIPGVGLRSQLVGEPRMVGVRVRYRFGE